MEENKNVLDKWFEFRGEELEQLEKEILDSIEHFNRKYYMAGFRDAVEIVWRM